MNDIDQPQANDNQQIDPDKQDVPAEKKRKKTNIYRYHQDVLHDTEIGLKRLYDSVKLPEQENFNETKELNTYINLIEQWHYSVCPKYEFNFFLYQTRKFGTQNTTKNVLNQMRQAHKQIIPWDFVSNQKQEMMGEPPQIERQEVIDYNQYKTDQALPDQDFLAYVQGKGNNNQNQNINNGNLPAQKKLIQIKAPFSSNQQQPKIQPTITRTEQAIEEEIEEYPNPEPEDIEVDDFENFPPMDDLPPPPDNIYPEAMQNAQNEENNDDNLEDIFDEIEKVYNRRGKD